MDGGEKGDDGKVEAQKAQGGKTVKWFKK